MVFDINDFDETAPGPWEWDVKRLATSMEIAGEANGHSPAERRKTVLGCAQEYREAMRRFAKMSNLEIWYVRLDIVCAATAARCSLIAGIWRASA